MRISDWSSDVCSSDLHGCLLPWARQGVLLLNAVLSVQAGLAGSHQGKGWEGFTDHIVETLNREREGLVFMLWGSYAQAKGRIIDNRRHCVLRSEEHTSELQSLMRISYAVFCLKKQIKSHYTKQLGSHRNSVTP